MHKLIKKLLICSSLAIFLSVANNPSTVNTLTPQTAVTTISNSESASTFNLSTANLRVKSLSDHSFSIFENFSILGTLQTLAQEGAEALEDAFGPMTSYAATSVTYSPRWNIDANQVWHYTMDNGTFATNAWVQDECDSNWYLLDSAGNMRAGIFESYGRYYLLDDVRGTGHYGRLVLNGQNFKGITIVADTSASYQGALSQQTIQQLQALGYNFGTAASVTGTQHVSAGRVTVAGSSTASSGSYSGASSGASQAQVQNVQQQQAAQVQQAQQQSQSSGMDNSIESHMVDNEKALQNLLRGMSGVDFEEYFKGVTFY